MTVELIESDDRFSSERNIPTRATAGSAGFDLFAHVKTRVVLQPGDKAAISCGWKFNIPRGYEVQIRSRSGLAWKYEVVVLNSPGTIDSDYRGTVYIMLKNMSNDVFFVENGMRIAQAVLCELPKSEFVKLESGQLFDETERGDGKFGSTGK